MNRLAETQSNQMAYKSETWFPKSYCVFYFDGFKLEDGQSRFTKNEHNDHSDLMREKISFTYC